MEEIPMNQISVRDVWAHWCALQCRHLWDMPEVVYYYLTLRDSDAGTAYKEAQQHIDFKVYTDSGSPRWKAAYSSVHACFGGEARGACYKSASALVNSTITTKETVGHIENLVDTKVRYMTRVLCKSKDILDTIKHNGISARLLDEIIDHSDYVILLLRHANNVDLPLWEDWYKQTKYL